MSQKSCDNPSVASDPTIGQSTTATTSASVAAESSPPMPRGCDDNVPSSSTGGEATNRARQPCAVADYQLPDPPNQQTRKWYQVACPSAMKNCNPMLQPEAHSCLYIIDMQPDNAATTDTDQQNGAHQTLLGPTSRRFGLLTAKRLPPVGSIPLRHPLVGRVTATIRTPPRVLPVPCPFKAGDISILRDAHRILFRNMLVTEPKFLEHVDQLDATDRKHASSVNDFLVLPCTPTGDLDTVAIAAMLLLPEENDKCLGDAADNAPDEEERRQHIYAPDVYSGAVVTPWYCPVLSTARYAVTRVRDDLTPDSPGPGAQAGRSFAQQARRHRAHRPVNTRTAYMLEVRQIQPLLGAEMPALAPVEFFMPEMCQRFSLTSDLWLQAMMLPGFLQKLTSALHAAELRVDINSAIGIVAVDVANYRPEPLFAELPIESDHQTPNGVAEHRARFEPLRLLGIGRQTATDGPHQCDLLAALTAATGSSPEAGRLFSLGAAVVQFAATLFLMRRHADWPVGQLQACKRMLVSGRKMGHVAEGQKLADRIRVQPFGVLVSWLPPGVRVPETLVSDIKMLLLSRMLMAENIKQREADSVADNRTRPSLVSFFMPEDYETTLIPDINERADHYLLLGVQFIDSDVVVDAAIACVGATVRAVGIERTFVALRHWDVLPADAGPLSTIDIMSAPFADARCQAGDCTPSAIDALLPNVELLEAELAYKFRDRVHLLQALTHPTYAGPRLTGGNQQRLQFLGSALLDLLVTVHLDERHAGLAAGRRDELCAVLTDTVTLAGVCVRHRFERHLLTAKCTMFDDMVTEFRTIQTRNGHRMTDATLLLLTDAELKFTGSFVGDRGDGSVPPLLRGTVPVVLGHVVHALIGAVFVDSGHDAQRTWQTVWQLLGGEVEQFVRRTPVPPVRRLLESMAAAGEQVSFEIPVADVYADGTDDGAMMRVTVQWTVGGGGGKQRMATAYARTAEEAMVAAAKAALTYDLWNCP